MYDPFVIQDIISNGLMVLWILLDLILAGIVLYRFRLTASGFLLGAAHIAFVLKNFASLMVYGIVFRHIMPDMEIHLIVSVLFRLASIASCLVLAAGLAFVPRSLRKLGART